MARGRSCQVCGYAMYATNEDAQEKGTWVTYECRNGACKEKIKVFEPR